MLRPICEIAQFMKNIAQFMNCAVLVMHGYWIFLKSTVMLTVLNFDDVTLLVFV